MPGNSFGEIFRLTTFGESHGASVGGIIDGCPAGLRLTTEDLQRALDLRKPGNKLVSTSRKESDRVQILSGIFQNMTMGTPISFAVYNENQRSSDYEALKDVFRPGHADWGYWKKFHGFRDYRGGGRASGRETIGRVAAGAVADILLSRFDIKVLAATVELGGISSGEIDLDNATQRPYFACNDILPALWDEKVHAARSAGDSLGGIVRIEARHVPAGLGEPVFDKLDALLAHAIMSVGAVKGVEIGDGFASARATGSTNNDPILPGGLFASNHAGGILGGISSGQDIIVRAAVKPIPSIALEQLTVDKEDCPQRIRVGGRHDLSAIPRCVPVLRAMVALVLADALLLQQRERSFS